MSPEVRRAMPVTAITARTLLRRHERVDSWFVARYGMNLYRGCPHACAYCDGRAERYHVEGEFGRDVAAKVNAAELLDRELDPARHRVPRRPGFVLLGGGVGDAYGPPERDLGLARAALEVLQRRGYPVHVLTRSTLVERDLDHPASDDLDALNAHPDIAPACARLIEEILDTGTSARYDRALRDGPSGCPSTEATVHRCDGRQGLLPTRRSIAPAYDARAPARHSRRPPDDESMSSIVEELQRSSRGESGAPATGVGVGSPPLRQAARYPGGQRSRRSPESAASSSRAEETAPRFPGPLEREPMLLLAWDGAALQPVTPPEPGDTLSLPFAPGPLAF